jgi:hypothetical protein
MRDIDIYDTYIGRDTKYWDCNRYGILNLIGMKRRVESRYISMYEDVRTLFALGGIDIENVPKSKIVLNYEKMDDNYLLIRLAMHYRVEIDLKSKW